MRTISLEEDLQLDGLVYMETRTEEPGLALDWNQKRRCGTSSTVVMTPTVITTSVNVGTLTEGYVVLDLDVELTGSS